MRLSAGRHPRTLSALILVLFTTIGLLAHSALGAARSDAAQDGLMLSYGGWTVGTRQLASGEFVYCVEPGAITPAGDQLAAAEVDELRGYSFFTYDDTGWAGATASEAISGEPLRRINYVLSRYGGTTDAAQAVAVQFAIWLLRDSPGEAPWLEHHIAWVETHGGVAEIARARVLADEARLLAVPPWSPGPAALRMEAGEEHGTGSVSYPAGTAELRIEGGTFADGSERLMPDGEGGVAQWRANLHAEGWEGAHEVTVAGDWSTSGTGWPARLLIYPAVFSAEQTLAWAVGPVSQSFRGAFDAVSLSVDAVFAPVLSTEVVQERLLAGRDPFADTLEIDVAAGSAPWPERGGPEGTVEHLTLRLEGVVYGPFPEPQAVSDEAPEGAPVAARVELTIDDGPGGYEAVAPEAPSESGYYYWVWTISEAAQDPALRAAGVLPPHYSFSDRFGLPAERHSVTAPEKPAETGIPAPLARTGGGPTAPLVGVAALLMLGAGAGAVLRGASRRRFADVQRTCRGSR